MRFPIAVAALLLSGFVSAQDLRFHEKIEVRLIELNAVVTDRAGHRVYGLTPDDFEVYEGRSKQAITNFAEYRSTPATPPPAAPASAPAAEPVRERAREPHSLLVLVDALPRTDQVRQQAFRQLDDLLSRILQPGDHLALIYWEPDLKRARNIIESSDRAAVMQALRDFARGVSPDSSSTEASARADNNSAVYSRVQAATAGRGSPIDFDAQRTASAEFEAEDRLMVLHKKCEGIRRLIEALGTRQGKKAVVYVSDTFRLEGDSPNGAFIRAKRYIDEITRAANANDVTFYAVRPAPVADPTDAASADRPPEINPAEVTLTAGALQRITDPTGGLLDLDRHAIANLAPMIADDLESYYSLAYQAKTDGGDRVRDITVKVKNPAYRVRARTAVVEKSAATAARETVVSRLFIDYAANDIQFELRQGELKRTSGNRWLLPIFVKIPASQLQFADEKGKAVAHAAVLIASANGVAEVTPVSENELRIVNPEDLVHGFVTYSAEILGDTRGSKVSIGIVDRRTGAVGVRTIDNRNRFP